MISSKNEMILAFISVFLFGLLISFIYVKFIDKETDDSYNKTVTSHRYQSLYKILSLTINIDKADTINVLRIDILQNGIQTSWLNRSDDTYTVSFLDSADGVLKQDTFSVEYIMQNNPLLRDKKHQIIEVDELMNIVMNFIMPINTNRVRITGRGGLLLLDQTIPNLQNITQDVTVSVIKISNINNKDILSGMQTIKWSDFGIIDRQKTKYRVYYSNNMKEFMLLTETNDLEAVINLDLLPGGKQCQVKIEQMLLSNDNNYVPTGIYAVSNAFQVQDKSPDIRIVSPINGKHYYYEDNILLKIETTDIEDGTILSPDRIVWRHNRYGIIANSDTVSVKLPVGTHSIAVLVKDSAGNISKKDVTFVVSYHKK